MKNNGKYDQMYELYKRGFSLENIANSCNITRQAVYAGFKRRGFHLRSPKSRSFKIYDGIKFTLRNTGYFASTIGERKLMHRYVWEKFNGQIPEGYDIHHKDENKANNNIENLECLSKSEHTRLYSPHNNQFTKGRKRKTS